jgi:hypothetical protein
MRVICEDRDYETSKKHIKAAAQVFYCLIVISQRAITFFRERSAD